MPGTNERYLLNASWLIKLRWVAVFGQLITIAAVQFLFQVEIRMLWALITVIALTASSNAIFHFLFYRVLKSHRKLTAPWDIILGLLMLMDILSLTTLLFASGGPSNPFSLFFFVNLSLSAVVLGRIWAWALNCLTILCFAFLLCFHHQIPQLSLGMWMLPISELRMISLPQLGLFVAFATCSSVIVYFMIRLTDEIQQQEADLREAEQRQSRAEKVEALGTLAAGAAHELATPLSTIAVVAKDVESILQEPPDPTGKRDAELVDDVRLIRSELDRCRKILDTMAVDSGQAVGEAIRSVTVNQLWQTIIGDLAWGEAIRWNPSPDTESFLLDVPLTGVCQAIRGLVQNAYDASVSADQLSVRAECLPNQVLKIQISDRGTGMPPEVLERVSEPFFTTKPPGKGMGLGVYLAQNVINRIGGQIKFESEVGSGTNVIIQLPTRPSVGDKG